LVGNPNSVPDEGLNCANALIDMKPNRPSDRRHLILEKARENLFIV